MDTEKLNRWLALAANIGMLIGLILLVYEVRQNSDLMRAQISMERTNTNMQILTDIANGGELLPIDVKLQEQVEGFPRALGWSRILTAEEKRRYEFWMFAYGIRQGSNQIPFDFVCVHTTPSSLLIRCRVSTDSVGGLDFSSSTDNEQFCEFLNDIRRNVLLKRFTPG